MSLAGNMFADLVPAANGASTATPTPAATQQMVPLTSRGVHPVAADYRNSDGSLDPNAFAAAMHNWLYVPNADPATVPGYTGTPASGGSAPPPAGTGTPSPTPAPAPASTPAPTPAPASGGTAGGTPGSQLAAFNTFYASPAYQVPLAEGLKAVNTKYAALGALESGAAMKAISDYGAGHAASALGTYMDDLYRQEALGAQSAAALAGVGTNMVNQVSSNNSAAGTAAGNAALVGGQAAANNWGNIGSAVSGGLGTIAGAMQSSYAPNNTLATTSVPSNPIAASPTGNYVYGSGAWG